MLYRCRTQQILTPRTSGDQRPAGAAASYSKTARPPAPSPDPPAGSPLDHRCVRSRRARFVSAGRSYSFVVFGDACPATRCACFERPPRSRDRSDQPPVRRRHRRGRPRKAEGPRRSSARTAPAPHHHASGLQVAAGRLAPDPGRPLDPPQRPAEASQRQDLLSFLFSQDVAHAGQEHAVPDRRQRLGALSGMAGFQVSTNGRFWVSTEVHEVTVTRTCSG